MQTPGVTRKQDLHFCREWKRDLRHGLLTPAHVAH
jgi:hypothetical protein